MAKYNCVCEISLKDPMTRELGDEALIGTKVAEVFAESEEEAIQLAKDQIMTKHGTHKDQRVMLKWDCNCQLVQEDKESEC
ncbi:hypothetical protein [Bacteriovorax sp. BAL6_X]|uniref:hypothetical protein n=1 Tax=Bacteriovorax sp. BAL6_X TaxID=1201290 RepID=UPI0012ECE72A|nr:hypothetical protein [Bacteriovorax sp. BAL6_X]